MGFLRQVRLYKVLWNDTTWTASKRAIKGYCITRQWLLVCGSPPTFTYKERMSDAAALLVARAVFSFAIAFELLVPILE